MDNSNSDSQLPQQLKVSEEEAKKTSESPLEKSLQSDVESVLKNLLKGYTELNELTSLTDFVDKTIEIRIKARKVSRK